MLPLSSELPLGSRLFSVSVSHTVLGTHLAPPLVSQALGQSSSTILALVYMALPKYDLSSPPPPSALRTSLLRRPDIALVKDITSLPQLREAVCAMNLFNCFFY